jgi:maltooligosyltrehalose synthase
MRIKRCWSQQGVAQKVYGLQRKRNEQWIIRARAGNIIEVIQKVRLQLRQTGRWSFCTTLPPASLAAIVKRFVTTGRQTGGD